MGCPGAVVGHGDRLGACGHPARLERTRIPRSTPPSARDIGFRVLGLAPDAQVRYPAVQAALIEPQLQTHARHAQHAQAVPQEFRAYVKRSDRRLVLPLRVVLALVIRKQLSVRDRAVTILVGPFITKHSVPADHKGYCCVTNPSEPLLGCVAAF